MCALAIAVVALLGGCGEDKVTSSSGTTSQSTTQSVAPVGGDAVRYLALGDSLTQGVGADELTGAFPVLLAQEWRSAGCKVELHNAGVSGYTSGQVLAEQVPQIGSFQPTLITFQAGGNDIVNGVSVDEYRQNVRAVLDSAKASGTRVVVLAQNEWFRSPEGQNYGSDLSAQRDTYDAVLIEEAAAHGAEFVDLRSLYKQQADDGQWVDDGIHPTPAAYQAWASELASAVPTPCK
jgi:lysophospholipase L1-like esterase